MLDKIILHSNRKQAALIFTDRQPVTVSSDVDVVPLLLLFLGHPHAKVIQHSTDVFVIELRRDSSDEVTVKIQLKDVA